MKHVSMNARTTSVLAVVAGFAALAAVSGCGSSSSGGSSTNTTPPTKTNTISIAGGNNQSGIAGAPLAAPLQVLVVDSAGKPVSGATVSFAVTAGSGTLSAATATTGAVGTAVTTLTLGHVAGINAVVASVTGATGSPLTFNESGVFGGAAMITASNTNVGISVGGSQTLTVNVTDTAGNPVPSVLVTFSTTGSNATLSSSTATSDAQGNASITVTGTGLGSLTVTAAAANVGTTVAFNVTVNPSSIAPVISGISVVANSSGTLAAPIVVGPSAIQYTIATPGSVPANLSVRVDLGDGLGFRPATEASWPPATKFQGAYLVDGTTNVPTSSAGSTHVFLWDSQADGRTTSTDGAQIQITASIPGAVGAPASISNVKIRNGETFGTTSTSTISAGSAIPVGANIVATADMDLDGILDLITVDTTSNQALIYLGNGSGGFATAPGISIPLGVAGTSGEGPGAVVVGDVDQNGLPDIIVFNTKHSDVSVLLQGPKGTFTLTGPGAGMTYNPGLATTGARLSLALADIAGTGSLDIVLASSVDPHYTVLQQTKPGVFIAPGSNYPIALPSNPTGIAVADVNSDGKLDVVVSMTNNSIAVVVSGTAPVPQVFAAGTNPVGLALADLNSDGLLDVVVVNSGVSGTASTVSVLFGTGSNATQATFAPAVNFGVGTLPVSVSLVDLDGDGKTDIVVANSSGAPNVTFLQNQGAQGATTPKFVAIPVIAPVTGQSPAGILTADFNRDGEIDVVTLNSTTPNITFIPNTLQAKTSVSFPGTTITVTGVGTGFPTFSQLVIADLNKDGIPDVIAADDLLSGTSVVNIFYGTGNGNYAAPVVFQGGTGLATSGFLRGLLVADFDGDGNLDIMVADSLLKTFNFYLGDGAGNFSAKQTVAFGTMTSSPQKLVVADVNGDGKPDIILLDLPSSGVSAQVLTNQCVAANGAVPATLAFTFNGSFAIGNGPYALRAGDLNGDGLADFVVVNQGDQTVSTFKNTGTKGSATVTFTRADHAVGRVPTDAAIVDVNGDGHPDVVVTNATDNNLAVLTGDGTGAISTAVNFAAGLQPTFIAVGDLNADGKSDLVVCNAQSSFLSLSVGGGSNGLVAKPSIPIPASNGSIAPASIAAVADLNGDGNKDVLYVNNKDQINIVFGDSTADFTPKNQLFSTGGFNGGSNTPLSVAVGDLNGDGLPDLVTANNSDGTVSILLANPRGGYFPASKFTPLFTGPGFNHPLQVAIADVNQDGKLDILVLGQSLGSINGDAIAVCLQGPNATFPSASQTGYKVGSSFAGTSIAMAVADVNGDGSPDVVVVNAHDATFSVLLGSPTGVYTSMTSATGNPGPFTYSNGSGAWGVAIGDVNHDGKPDIAIVNGDGSVSVLAGPGFTVNLAASSTLATGLTPTNVTAIAIADLNRDGNPDIVVAGTKSTVGGIVSYFLGDGAGNFTAGAGSPINDQNVVPSARSLVIADVNRDGLPDLVITNPNSLGVLSSAPDNVVVLLQGANTKFPTASPVPPLLPTGLGPTGLAIIDRNHDGLLDLAVTNQTDGTVQIFQQK